MSFLDIARRAAPPVSLAAMQPYGNLSGRSGVDGFDIGPAHIDVRFAGGAVYRYTPPSVGQADFDEMVRLARAGRGLSGFISRVVRDRYAARLD